MANRFRQFRLLLWKNFILQVSTGLQLFRQRYRVVGWLSTFITSKLTLIISDPKACRNGIWNTASNSPCCYTHITEVSEYKSKILECYKSYFDSYVSDILGEAVKQSKYFRVILRNKLSNISFKRIFHFVKNVYIVYLYWY